MKRFQYKISQHSSEEFSQLVYFCSPEGQCNLEKIPVGQMEKMRGILDSQGHDGWELVQVAFGRDGMLVFWKREVGGSAAGEPGAVENPLP